MSSIQMNVTKADVWWVTCQLCDFETKQTPDQEKAERKRLEHHAHHATLRASADAGAEAVASTELAQIRADLAAVLGFASFRNAPLAPVQRLLAAARREVYGEDA